MSRFGLVVAVMLCGCGPGQLDVTADRDVVAPGNCVGLVVENSWSFKEVEVDHGAPLLQGLEGDVWVDAATQPPRESLLWGMGVRGFSRNGFYAVVPAETPAGQHRFVVTVGTEAVASTPFNVEGPSQQMEEWCQLDGTFQP